VSLRAQRSLVAAAILACLLPFTGKAFHIDDPLFIWIARHIVSSPLDPYGFSVNWALTELPVSEITKNPPLTSYGLAAVGSLVGWSEAALHVAFLVPAVLFGLGTFELARRLGPRPLTATLAAVLTPVTLVCAGGVTSDVPMLAFWVWSMVLWHDGLDRGDHVRLAAAAVLVGLGALTKYFCAALLPLLVLYALLRREPAKRWVWHFAIPVSFLTAYQIWTDARYGRGLLLDAAEYATNFRAREAIPFLDRSLTGLAFTGGCMLSALACAPLAWPKKGLVAGGLAAIGGGALLAIRATAIPEDARLSIGIHGAFFIAGGLCVLALAIAEAIRERDAASIVLACWTVGTFVFAAFVNWTINGRSILPLVPAAAILLVRRLERRAPSRRGIAVALGVAGAVAAAVAVADAQLAGVQREASLEIRGRTRGRTVWFEGHWGFQYYMEGWGARALDLKAMDARPGEVVAFGYNNTAIVGLPKSMTGPTERFDVGPPFFAATMRGSAGAGFYASVFGPLPYRFGRFPPERYSMIEVK
jgi:4-amino-4-deoxy-L-arabinose transferase-like glycosyltransferase